MIGTPRRRSRRVDVWPGYVDVLSALLMLVIFVVLIFVLSQFGLTQLLSSRDQALEKLNRRIAEITGLLDLERGRSAELQGNVDELSATVSKGLEERYDLSRQLEEANARSEEEKARAAEQLRAAAGLKQEIEALTHARDALVDQVAKLRDQAGTSEKELTEEKRLSALAYAQIQELNRRLAELQRQLDLVGTALAEAEKKNAAQAEEISDLGHRLNLALAKKVYELERYRSEFFGRLRELLGDNPSIRVVGDRFLFQAELLFASGSAELEEGGRKQLDTLAVTLKEVAGRIPAEIPWVLRVDGHTDRTPIHTSRFASNWELSQARALSVVRYLAAAGVPEERLAPTGFAEFHPVDPADTPEALQRNRRIEIKLTER